jgi:hypothetical protein
MAPHTSHPYKTMGLINVSNVFFKMTQGLFRPKVFLILNQALRPFSISNLLEKLKLPAYFIVTPK